MFDEYCYDIVTIAEDCFDVYVSDDEGYTWEYYGSYERHDWALDDAEAAVAAARNRKSYISHGK
jgi:hypothetical protein